MLASEHRTWRFHGDRLDIGDSRKDLVVRLESGEPIIYAYQPTPARRVYYLTGIYYHSGDRLAVCYRPGFVAPPKDMADGGTSDAVTVYFDREK